MWKKFTILATSLVLVMGSASCGRTDSAQPGASETIKLSDPDVMFLQMMLPHHEQAIQMSDLALTNTDSKEILLTAKSIKKIQNLEISKMKSWLTEAGLSTAGHMMGEDGMMTDQQMTDLRAARGKDFDMQFLSGMIVHHRGAIAMAQTEMEQGSNPKVKAMAAAIVVSQTAEVLAMVALRRHL
jgi:uncharacterized protein (DUF305 family)